MLKMGTLIFLLSSLFISMVTAQEIPPITFRISELQTVNDPVGNIPDSSTEIQAIVVNAESVQYAFLNQHDEATQLFRISESTGAIYIINAIDREVVCGFQPTCVISFQVAVRPAQDFFIVMVNVEVEDVNDNSPAFPFDEYLIEIPESVSIGSEYPVPTATDPDTGDNNGVRSYSIIPENGAFTLKVAEAAGSFDVHIVVAELLDRETVDSYRVFVTAKDGGNPQNIGTLAVNISVTDTNDNKPTFTKDVYNVTVTENTSNKVITSVLANDKDIGAFGEVYYSIGSQVLDEIRNTFSINERTGDITALLPLAYRPGVSYQIPVEVRDGGVPPLSSQAVVNVNVLDTTNNAPVISVNLLSGLTDVVNIPENSQRDAFVAHVSVEDTDTGSNGVVTCELNDDTFSLSAVSGGQGYKVIVRGQLDRELQASYDITVTCQDHASPPLQAEKSFRVQLTDINDNPPRFLQGFYSVSVEENNEIGQVIAVVSAADRDLGSNGEVSYELAAGEYSTMFAVSSVGVITANDVFDRETIGNIKLTVFACDTGCTDDSLRNSAIVSVDILDQNDNPPEFNETTLIFSISENELSDFVLGTIHATDSDAGTNGTVELFLPSSVAADLPFILFRNGILKTNQELDREQQSRYDFNIQAKDMGVPPKYSVTTVTVIVLDENDNAPVVTFPNPNNKTVSVEYRHSLNIAFMRVEAYDLDDDQNSALTYSIVNGNRNVFNINSQTGHISLLQHINIREDMPFDLTIAVTDNGEHAHETQSSLIIRLLYKNTTNPTANPIDNSEQNDEQPGEKVEVKNKNLIVILVVSIVTIVIAVAIVTIICIVRRGDKSRKQASEESGKPGPFTLDGKDNPAFLGSVQNGIDKKDKRKVSFCIDSVDQGRLFNPPHYDNIATSSMVPVPMNPHLNNSSAYPLASGCNDMSMDDTSDSGRGGSEDDMQISPKDDRSNMTSRNRSPIYPLNGQLDLSFPKGFTAPIVPPDDSGISTSSYQRQPTVDDFHQDSFLPSHSAQFRLPEKLPLRKDRPVSASQKGLKPRAQFEQRRARTPDTALRARSNDDLLRSRTPDDILRLKVSENFRPNSTECVPKTQPPALSKQNSLDSSMPKPPSHMTYLTDCDPNFSAPIVQFKEHEFVKDLIV